ncbi:non-homologous end-joining DNA ligase [Guyparkeria hydrothermalis]|uniref:non-homologous end-joining DNA ligase n=1 Tax=Guyparkeria hydrothermalis TaxID=923 RepID=UPI002021EB2B|nr:non-homologous end-joining DNA ligase [Guyparkeria hydrothermalis]MCL7744216.1 non-homologous end-joining DNA ligase [Guyparkeria hydrothermalis]
MNEDGDITRPDKILYPDDGWTKADVVGYYRRVAEFMLPHLAGRPLTLHRFPDGLGEEGFFQQAYAEHFPEWVGALLVRHDEPTGPVRHILCEDVDCLAFLADQATITFHRWAARGNVIDRPDLLIFDLDPPDDDMGLLKRTARRVAALMRDCQMSPFVMTTGSTGLHVVAPLQARQGFDDVRDLAGGMAERLAAAYPDELTTEQRREARKGRLYLDVMRNAFGQTAVAPYSLRARPGAPVATPLDWVELDKGGLRSDSYTLENVFRRLGQKGDPWAGMFDQAADPEAARRALDQLG